MRHLDLFSGIGGFAYAARIVWGDEYRNVGFCEIDPFCQAVLRKNFPGCQIFGDIRTLANTPSTGLEGSDRGKPTFTERIGRIGLITGGFPCQPFSVAGRRRGTSDDRYLWPEMFRVIQRFKPLWVIAENVGGLVTWNEGMVLEQVCIDLESEGYEVQPFIIPACAVNAPHRRDRVWIVAHGSSEQNYGKRQFSELRWDSLGRQEKASQQVHRSTSNNSFGGQNSHATNTISKLSRGKDSGAIGDKRRATSSGRSKSVQPENWEAPSNNPESSSPDWNRDWKEVALATCHDGMDDGLSRRVVRLPDGSEISHAKWRKEALKAYGNAIVPQVVIRIMEAIKKV